MRKVCPNLLAISIILLCANACDDSENGSSETPRDCQITQSDCASQGKTFDATNCNCIDSQSPQGCQITSAICESLGKTFDATNCNCIDSQSPQGCQITSAICESLGKKLDATNCSCVDSGSPQANCPLTEAMCASANKYWMPKTALASIS